MYVLASGYDLTGDGRYRAELRRGADFLLGAFLDPQNGGVCTDDLRQPFEATLAFVRAELVDPENGAWYFSPRSECAGSACADEQPDVDYHVVALNIEALALSGAANARPGGDERSRTPSAAKP